MVKDFKKTLGERKTPSSVIKFNWLIIVIIVVTIIMQSVEYHIVNKDVDDVSGENEHNLNSERRTILIA